MTKPDIKGILRCARHALIISALTTTTYAHAGWMDQFIDPSDNKFLEVAVSGRADFVISGDIHLVELEHHAGIPIISAWSFLKLLHQNSSE